MSHSTSSATARAPARAAPAARRSRYQERSPTHPPDSPVLAPCIRTPASADTELTTCTVSPNDFPSSSTDSTSGIVGPLLRPEQLNTGQRILYTLLQLLQYRVVPIVQHRTEQRSPGLLPRCSAGPVPAAHARASATAPSAHVLPAPPPRPTLPSTSTRSGSVLMNSPTPRVAPSPACIRPNSTVPKTTRS